MRLREHGGDCTDRVPSRQLHRATAVSIFATMNEGRLDGLPASFFELVRTSPMPVLVDFWAEWCGPCRIVSPTIERLARENHSRLLTVKVNVDRRPQVAQAYEIQGIPTIMLFWRGEPRMRLTGAYPYEAILQNIQENWPSGAGGTP
jgi:thioredoxin 1